MDRYLRFNKKCKLALFLLLSVAGMGKGYAYSFSAVCPTGQTLYYNITDATNHYVKVTYPVYGWEGDDYTKPAGNLILPEIVEYDGNNYIVTSIGDDAFRNCDDLLSVNLSNSVKIIGNYAFVGCYSINSVTIPNSVTFIGAYAFSGCYTLTTIIIPNSVTVIGASAFDYCQELTSVDIPNSVYSIGDEAFYSCSKLSTITIGNSVKELGSEVFKNTKWYSNHSSGVLYLDGCCIGYKGSKPTGSLVIQDGTRLICDAAFRNCTGLTSVTIPNSVTSIGSGAFNGCSSLSTITIGNTVDHIGTAVFTNTSWYNSQLDGLLYLNNYCLGYKGSRPTGALNLQEGTRVIAGKAFYYCTDLTSITIPNSVVSIDELAFTNCSSIVGELIIPNSVSFIGWDAFGSCSNLTSLTIGSSVAVMRNDAFEFCTSLTSINALPETPPSIIGPRTPFAYVPENIPVIVPCGSRELYQNADYFSRFSNIQESGYEISSVIYPTEGGVVTGAGNYCHGTSCTLTATPAEGYTFVNWTENGEEVSTDATYSFTIIGDRTLVANFTESSNANHWTTITGTQYNLTMSGVIYIDGVVQTSTSLEVGAFCGDECRGSARAQYFPPTGEYVVSLAVVSNQQSGETITFRLYDHDTQQEFPSECVNSITFVANANFGEMGNWYSFAFNHAVAVTATVTPEGAGVVEGMGDYLLGTSCTLMATANTGYMFVNWTENGEVVSTDNSYTFTVNGAVELTANFSLNSYDINASANPTEGGTIIGSGTYDHFSTCTLTATANTGYAFQSWSVAGEVVSTDNPYTFTVSSGVEVIANFELISYDITAIANPTEAGTITGAGSYTHGSTCTLTATANIGYALRSWSVDGEVVSTDNPYTFTVIGGVEVMANFDAQETTALAEGWTWWSTSIELSGIDGLTMLEESLGHNGLMIKSANKFVQNYYPNTGYDYWFGQLSSDDFTNASSYMIQTSASCEVTMTGAYADPLDHPIQLYPGWTWIGYPCGSQQSATSAFASFTPTNNDKVKGQFSFATYYDNYGWFPEFTMTPSEGYLYQSLASNTRTLTFANGSKDNSQPAKEEDRYWRNNIHAYADNMNVIAVVTINDEEQQGEDLELGAFVSGECRGSAVLKYFQPTDRWYAMLTVTGADGDQIDFRIIDKGKGLTSMTSNRSLVFQSNAVVGELDEPYTIGFGTLGCMENNLMGTMHIYPNPIDCNTTFSIVIPESETVRNIYIVNMMGEVVAHETSMSRSLALQAPGVYVIKVVCDSDNVYVGKLIVK